MTQSTLSTPSKCFEEDEAEETTEKKLEIQKNQQQKIGQVFFYLTFQNCPQKRCLGGRCLHP